MPPHRVITSLAALLSAPTEPVLPAGRVSAARPALAADLPGLTVGMALAGGGTVSPSRFQREGDQLVQHRGLFIAQSGVNGFSSGLTTLDLSPLPLRHKPPAELTSADVSIVNTTVPGVHASYRAVVAPATREEFRVDFSRARIVFGAPQRAGDQLDVSHWTVSWREPLRWERLQGALLLELWSTSALEGAALTQRLQDRLATAAMPRAFGFLRLSPQRVESAESVQQTSGVAGAFPAWRQRLEYAFAHEYTGGGEASDGAAIRRIDVTIDDTTPDHLTIGH